jgi:hypothetical protein
MMIRSLFTSRVLLAGLALAIIMFAATLTLLWFTRPESKSVTPADAILNITPAPTATLAPPTPEPTPTATAAPQSPEGLAIGQNAQVFGTGGEGLRLRAAPGLNGEILLLGSEGEIYRVQDGPQQVDGYTWWLLVDPNDQTRTGWAVADFLKPAQSP